MQVQRQRFLLATALVLVLLNQFDGRAVASCAGRITLTGLTPIYITSLNLAAGHTYTIKTINLSAGSDTVLHVQDSFSKAFVAGNDDCAPPNRDSCVTITPSTTTLVNAFVRTYFSQSMGTAQLQVLDNGVVSQTFGPFPFGGQEVVTDSSGVRNVNYFYAHTAAVWKQATDTLLLLEGATIDHADTFDDDSGWNGMSSLFFSGTTNNTLVVGTYPNTPGGETEIIWDTDDFDNDGDNLGNCLEDLLGTSSSTADADGDGVIDGTDTDGDGLPDFLEVTGEVATHGANPTVQDAFVEADWYQCTGSGCSTPDDFRLSADTATKIVKFYKSPNGASETIAMHIDTGLDNPATESDPSFYQWGNWNGANRRTDQTLDCSSLSTPRRGIFRLDVVTCALGCGNRFTMAPDCAAGDSPGAIAHEMGHLMGMDHGPTGGINFQATYESPMNYAHQERITIDDVNFNSFSTNKYANILINPYTGIDEQNWKGTNTADIKYFFQRPFFYYNGGGTTQTKVDWNQDNVIQASGTKVKARVNWVNENGYLRRNQFSNETSPALAWYQTPVGNRLYFFDLTSSGFWQYRYSTDAESACKVERALTDVNQDLTSSCATWSTPVVTGRSGISVVSAVQYPQGGVNKLMLVDTESSGSMKFATFSVDSSGTEIVGASLAVPGSTGVVGSPQAVYDSTSQVIDVYAPLSGQLRRWTYNIASGQWTRQGVQQVWVSGTTTTPITGLAEGIGAAWGQLRGSTTVRLFGVLPYGSSTNADVGRKDTMANEQWIKFGATGFQTDSRIGLVYIPNTSQSDGRLLALFRGSGQQSFNAISEGNDATAGTTSRRITTWYVSQHGGNTYGGAEPISTKGVTLIYNSAIDTNARGAVSLLDGTRVDFLPVSDGLINHTFRDQNDYQMLKKNVACALSQGTRCWHCNSVAAGGGCASWAKL